MQAEGITVWSATPQRHSVESQIDNRTFPSNLEGLTQAELRVLAFIAQSRTNREIAEDLFVSVRTVETHRYNICSKLEIKGSHALLRFAVSNRSRILNRIKLSDPT